MGGPAGSGGAAGAAVPTGWRGRAGGARAVAVSAMEGQRLPGAVNPNHFPGKLWLLVNSPRCGSVRWDARGEGLLIDRQLFERELLGAGPAGDRAAVAADFFKTKNFPSFIRQLNLYSFRKLGPGPCRAWRGSTAAAPPGPCSTSRAPISAATAPTSSSA